MIKFTDEEDPREHKVAVRHGNPFVSAQTVEALVRKGLSRLETNERDGRLYASQAAVCARQAFLTSTQQDASIVTPASAAYFALGSTIEELVLEALAKEHVLLFAQYRLPDIGLNLGGYIDGIVHIKGRIRVLEVKSCSELPSEPKLEHLAQAMVYSAVTGLPPIIFYFSRHVAGYDGQLKVREFSLTPSEEERRETLFRVAYARYAINEGMMPSIPLEFTSEKDCGYCPWRDICWHGAPAPAEPVDTAHHAKFTKLAYTKVNELTDREVVVRRRNGILRHLAQHGTDDAKRLLAGDWTELLDQD